MRVFNKKRLGNSIFSFYWGTNRRAIKSRFYYRWHLWRYKRFRKAPWIECAYLLCNKGSKKMILHF